MYMDTSVDDMLLFGSRARGEARRDSDYDVAVFVRDLQDARAITHLLGDAAFPHVLNGFHIRPIAVQAGFLGRSATEPLAASLARDGIAIP